MAENYEINLKLSPTAHEKFETIKEKLKRFMGVDDKGADSFGLLAYANSLLEGERREVTDKETVTCAVRFLDWYLTEIVEDGGEILVRKDGVISEAEISFD